MGLQAAAKTVEASKPGPKCGFGSLLKTLPSDDVAYYRQMLAEGKTWVFIAAVFREDGHDVSADKVRRHSRGECACR